MEGTFYKVAMRSRDQRRGRERKQLKRRRKSEEEDTGRINNRRRGYRKSVKEDKNQKGKWYRWNTDGGMEIRRKRSEEKFARTNETNMEGWGTPERLENKHSGTFIQEGR